MRYKEYNCESIKKLREESELTVQELSKLSGVSASGLYKYEKGVLQPRYTTLRRIVNTLNEEIQNKKNRENMCNFIRKLPTEDMVEELGRRGFKIFLELI